MRELSQEMLDDVVTRLVDALHPERIYLFGSHARGDPHADSDIDLLVVVPESDQSPYDRDDRAYTALSGCLAPVEVMVFTHDEMARRANVRTSLPSTVMRKGKVIYGA